MKPNPLVTIVTPSFNQVRYLEEALLSVQRQDYPYIEHIVIDGGSTDGSAKVLERHGARLAFWVSEPDGGQTAALIKGFARATGSILAWLNSDDILAPSAVRIAVDNLQRGLDVGLVYGDRLHIDSRNNVIGVLRGPQWYPQMLRRNITLPQETAFFRRDAYERVGGLDPSLAFSMDFDLWCKLAAVVPFKHIPAYMGCFREHRQAKSVMFHSKGSVPSASYEAEHEAVFYRHFKRKPPCLFRRLYRVAHFARVLRDRFSSDRARDVERIREVTEMVLEDSLDGA